MSVADPDTATLRDRMIRQRAAEAVIWAMPAVNYDLMLQAALGAGAQPNQIVYWSHLIDWKNQTLTPNPDAIYLMPFIDTRGGPMVLEIPPADEGASITGNVCDVWQCALEDVGIAGVDKGQGGRYLIVPPGYADPVPDGFIVLPSLTYGVWALLRSTPKSGSDADVGTAVAYGRQVKLYPLSQSAAPPPTVFVDVVDRLFDSTIPYDVRFFASLDRIVQSEPWLERDRAMIDTVGSLGIRKGQPFAPDTAASLLLEAGARDARGALDALRGEIFEMYYPGGRWAVPGAAEVVAGVANYFTTPDAYPVDARAVTYSMGFVGIKHLGGGQFYLMTVKDRFDGGSTWRLRVPADAPTRQYWSVTAYDCATHALIRDVARYSLSSNTPGIEVNGDGSVDVYFGPAPPPGRAANWVPTAAGRRFELLFRIYGPEKPLLDKSWILPDVESVA